MKNESNPQRPQQLRCWEKMKTYVQSYACETLLIQLLEHRENEGQRTTAINVVFKLVILN